MGREALDTRHARSVNLQSIVFIASVVQLPLRSGLCSPGSSFILSVCPGGTELPTTTQFFSPPISLNPLRAAFRTNERLLFVSPPTSTRRENHYGKSEEKFGASGFLLAAPLAQDKQARRLAGGPPLFCTRQRRDSWNGGRSRTIQYFPEFGTRMCACAGPTPFQINAFPLPDCQPLSRIGPIGPTSHPASPPWKGLTNPRRAQCLEPGRSEEAKIFPRPARRSGGYGLPQPMWNLICCVVFLPQPVQVTVTVTSNAAARSA